jgi:hypothetical protein
MLGMGNDGRVRDIARHPPACAGDLFQHYASIVPREVPRTSRGMTVVPGTKSRSGIVLLKNMGHSGPIGIASDPNLSAYITADPFLIRVKIPFADPNARDWPAKRILTRIRKEFTQIHADGPTRFDRFRVRPNALFSYYLFPDRPKDDEVG